MSAPKYYNAVELQWLEHWWLVYHSSFKLVLESLGKNPIATDTITVMCVSIGTPKNN